MAALSGVVHGGMGVAGWRRRLVKPLVLSLAAGLLVGLPALPAAAATGDDGPEDRSVSVSPMKPKVDPLPAMEQYRPAAVAWPAAASMVVDVPSALSRSAAAPVSIGGLPVTVMPVLATDDISAQGLTAQPAPASVRLEVLDRATALAAGAPVALRLSRADGGTGAARVRLEVDTSSFRDAFGAAYLSRIQLRLAPECALSAVSEAQARLGACAGVPLATAVDHRSGIVSADVDLNMPLLTLSTALLSPKQQALQGVEPADAEAETVSGEEMIVLMASGSQAQGAGTFGKTDLKESGTWSHSGASGNFSYAYPLGVPPVPGSLAPDLSLNYSSASVDGRTAIEHYQNGPIGEGWSLAGAGFIESTFRPCTLDNSADHPATWTNPTGDPCWRLENYQLSWSGRSGELVPTGTANVWRVADDDMAKVEFVSSGNHWKITDGKGTQFFLGLQQLPGWTSGVRQTNSVLSQEVFANHTGEPCFHASGYTYSHCGRTYRWLLDYVVDVNGNSMSYWYTKFSNMAGSNGSGQLTVPYDRDAVLERIEYGTRAGNEATVTPPAKVEFTNDLRCLSNCGTEAAPTTASWVDTPWDQRCTAAPCSSNLTPSFWTTRRLSKITTKVWTGSSSDYKSVDEWALVQSFPTASNTPALWLESITRTGFKADGTSQSLPALTTHGRLDGNRADYDPNAGMVNPQRYRIDYLDTETGGRMEVSYAPIEPACTWWSGKQESEWPNYNHNQYRCYHQWYTNPSEQSAWTFWHKFIVDKITEKDLGGGSPDKVTTYTYTMDGATTDPDKPVVLWGYSTSWWASPKKAMSAWKGYPTVITTVGAATETQSKTKRVYYRGLDRDTGLDPGQEFFRHSWVRDSNGIEVVDHPALAGQVREEIVYDGVIEISKTIDTHSVITETAGGSLPSWQTPPERKAHLSRPTGTTSYTKIIADGSWRVTDTVSTYDTTFGTLSQVEDKGQTLPALATDDNCARYSYARNTQDLVLRAGTGSGLVSASDTAVRVDWSKYDFVFTPGDFTGDGKADVLARNSLTSNLELFTGNGTGGFSAGPTEVGWGWTDMDFIFSPGDFSGDGKPDVLFRRPSTTNLYMIKGNGAGSWTGAITEVGWGWTDMDLIFSPGDFTGDGKTDVLFRRPSTGNLYYLAGNGAGSWTGPITQIGTGSWAAKDMIFGRGTVTGDAKTDLYMRDTTTGDLHLYAGTGTGTLGAPTLVSAGWKNYAQIVAVGNFTADTNPDLLARYGGNRLTGTVARVETVGVGCAVTPAYPADLLADSRSFYDGNTSHTAVPAKGLTTKAEAAKSHNGTTATYITSGETGYDTYGRPVWTKDPLGNQTDTSYTHDTAGLLTSLTVTSPSPSVGAQRHTVTTAFNTLRGLPLTVTDPNGKVTTGTYDPLGRLLTARFPGNTSAYPNTEYVYSVTKSGVSHVATKVLGPNGNQIASYEIFDGLLRLRQTQTITEAGKRAVSDVRYDSRGLLAKTSTFYNSASAPSSTPVFPTNGDVDIDRQTRYVYDGAARQTFAQVWKNDAQQWFTQTVHGGDRVGVIPPTGGTPTLDLFDSRGQLIEKRQYSGTPFTGTYDATVYTYDRAGQLIGVKDPGNNQWSYQYDLLGRKTQTTDPDAGTSSSTYDNASNLLSTTDSRNVSIFYEHDNLGRKTKQRADTPGGLVMSDWVYDTLAKGQMTSTSRYEAGGLTYTSAILDYDDAYRPEATRETAPGFGASGGVLTYEVTNTFKSNGALQTTVLPGVGGLPGETLTYTYSDTGYAKTLTGSWTGYTQTYVSDTTYHYDGLPHRQFLGATGQRVRLTTDYDTATRRLSRQWLSTEVSGTPGSFYVPYDYTYSYDQTGNITSIAGNNHGVAYDEECFRYDHLRRLTEAWTQTSGACTTPQRGGTIDPYWRQWTFDTIGNRRTQVDKNTSAGDTTWTYQVGAAGSVTPHQVKQITSTGPLATPTRTYSYDPAGNTLTQTGPTGNAQTHTWNKEGHLATTTDNGITTTYTYDSSGRRLIASDNAATPTKTLYLPDGTELEKIGSADPLGTRYYAGIAVRSTDGLNWTAANHQGTSTFQITPGNLTITPRRFMPYGEDRGAQPAAWEGTKGYVGGTKDTTGLTHLGAREYDPTTGRFISIDPIMDLASPQQMHGYSYANNNPTTHADPSGLYVFEDAYGGGQTFVSAKAGAKEGQRLKLLEKITNKYDDPSMYPTTVPTFAQFVEDNRHTHMSNLDDEELGQEYWYYQCIYITRMCSNYEEAYWTSERMYNQALWEGLLGVTDAEECADGQVSGCAWTAIGFVPWAKLGALARIGKADGLFAKAFSAYCSFSGDTHVLMADGTTKPISEVEIGDEVKSVDPQTGEEGNRVVTQLWIHDDELEDLAVGAGTVTTTSDHPFWNATDQQWQQAADLDPGDTLLTADGTHITVIGIVRGTQREGTAYNLTVADLHTYYVLAGKTPILVHNSDNCIRNGHLAGGNHPVTGVPFDKNGYPDFSAWRHPDVPDVRIELSGNRATDNARANKAAGLDSTPTGYTWHHHQDTGLMQLIDRTVHAKTGHTGGFSGH